jgi:hypothetical protein
MAIEPQARRERASDAYGSSVFSDFTPDVFADRHDSTRRIGRTTAARCGASRHLDTGREEPPARRSP